MRHLNLYLVGSILLSAACGARSGLDTLTASIGGKPSFGDVITTGGMYWGSWSPANAAAKSRGKRFFPGKMRVVPVVPGVAAPNG